MYSALGWLDGLAIDTGGVNVLIADTIVWNMETGVKSGWMWDKLSHFIHQNTTAIDRYLFIYLF